VKIPNKIVLSILPPRSPKLPVYFWHLQVKGTRLLLEAVSSESKRVPFNVVLYQPAIPQNTGSIARLCACTGARLHLIHPLGFRIDEASVRRAGLDYWPFVDIHDYENWDVFLEKENPGSLCFLSKLAERSYVESSLTRPVYLVFGSETDGLPQELWRRHPGLFFKVPMRTHLVRSLNLAQCVAIVLYEALRRDEFESLALP